MYLCVLFASYNKHVPLPKGQKSLFFEKECLLSCTNCITIQKKIIEQKTLRHLFAIILLPSVPKLLPYVCSNFARRMSGYRLQIHRHSCETFFSPCFPSSSLFRLQRFKEDCREHIQSVEESEATKWPRLTSC